MIALANQLGADGAASTDTLQLAVSHAVPQGQAIVVRVVYNGSATAAPAFTVIDAKGNEYTELVSSAGSAQTMHCAIFAAVAGVALAAGDKITAGCAAGDSELGLAADAFTGLGGGFVAYGGLAERSGAAISATEVAKLGDLVVAMVAYTSGFAPGHPAGGWTALAGESVTNMNLIGDYQLGDGVHAPTYSPTVPGGGPPPPTEAIVVIRGKSAGLSFWM